MPKPKRQTKRAQITCAQITPEQKAELEAGIKQVGEQIAAALKEQEEREEALRDHRKFENAAIQFQCALIASGIFVVDNPDLAVYADKMAKEFIARMNRHAKKKGLTV